MCRLMKILNAIFRFFGLEEYVPKSEYLKLKEHTEEVDFREKEQLINDAFECRKLYQEKIQEACYDIMCATPYWGFKNNPSIPGAITENLPKFSDGEDTPGIYEVKAFDDDISGFVQYRIAFSKINTYKLKNITNPKMQLYEAVDIADRFDLFGPVVKMLFDHGLLQCSLTIDENGLYVMYAAINLEKLTQ